MDIRVTESLATTGSLKDTSYRVNGSLENVSLSWDNEDNKLGVLDYNVI